MPARAPIDPQQALAAYDLGPVNALTPAGGTAGKTWKVSCGQGLFFLRLRGLRTSSPTRLQFDHGLRDHLLARGVPTAAPLPTRAGSRWLQCEAGVYELYPFVHGRAFDPQQPAEIQAAASALAGYHQAAAQYRPPVAGEAIAQYGTLGFSSGVSSRLDDPALLLANLQAVAELAPTGAERRLVERCLARVEAMQTTYAGPAYERLSGWVIHGDYTPANLLYSQDGQVVGIFDLDWAMPGARSRDVADGLYFFAAEPRRLDSASIWSLTEAVDFDPERCVAFLQAYTRRAPLTREEVEALPMAFAGRWFSIRLEGMAKVPREDRFRFFARQIEKPLAWLEAHWPPLCRRLISG